MYTFKLNNLLILCNTTHIALLPCGALLFALNREALYAEHDR